MPNANDELEAERRAARNRLFTMRLLGYLVASFAMACRSRAIPPDPATPPDAAPTESVVASAAPAPTAPFDTPTFHVDDWLAARGVPRVHGAEETMPAYDARICEAMLHTKGGCNCWDGGSAGSPPRDVLQCWYLAEVDPMFLEATAIVDVDHGRARVLWKGPIRLAGDDVPPLLDYEIKRDPDNIGFVVTGSEAPTSAGCMALLSERLVEMHSPSREKKLALEGRRVCASVGRYRWRDGTFHKLSP